MNIKVNDNVLVITGKYQGKQGKVLKTLPKQESVIVEGVNLVHKHEKARKANETSRIVTEEGPIHVSNVMIVCPGCNKPTRVYHKQDENGKWYRYHGGKVGCGASLDKAFAKKVKGKAAETAKEEAPKKRVRKRSQKTEAEAKE